MFNVAFKLVINPKEFLVSDISTDVTMLRWVQNTQIFDLLLIILGKSKGSLFGTMCQGGARLVVAWIFITPESDQRLFALVTIAWSVADVNRYLYYLFNKSPATTILRYNLFILLYPIGVYGEMSIINDYIKINAESLSN